MGILIDDNRDSGGGGSLPTDPVFNSVTTELWKSDTYSTLRNKDGVVIQDADGDYAYWDRHQGLQLFGQGTVNPSISGKQDIDITVNGNKNVAFKTTGMKLLSDVDCHNMSLLNLGNLKFTNGYTIEGGSVGNLQLRNIAGVYKNNSTELNSIHFEGDDVKHKAQHHKFFTNNSNSQMFGISSAGANLFNHPLINLRDGINDQDAVTVKQLKETHPVVITFDSIQEGLYNSIKSQDTPVRAMNTLGAALTTYDNTSYGIIDLTAEAIGALVPTQAEGGSKYGFFYFEFIHGNSNTMYTKWTDENGKVFEGVWSGQHWYGWSEKVASFVLDERELQAGLLSGEMYIEELSIN